MITIRRNVIISGATTTWRIDRDIVPTGSTYIPTSTTTSSRMVIGSIAAGGTLVAISGRISFAEGNTTIGRTTTTGSTVTPPGSVTAAQKTTTTEKSAVARRFVAGSIVTGTIDLG